MQLPQVAPAVRAWPRFGADDVSDVDIGEEIDPAAHRYAGVTGDHTFLHLDRAAHGINDGRKFDRDAVAGGSDDPPPVLCDLRVDEFAVMGLEAREGRRVGRWTPSVSPGKDQNAPNRVPSTMTTVSANSGPTRPTIMISR